MTAAHDEGGTSHGTALVKSPVPPGKATIHEHANTARCQHRGPAASAGGDAVLPPVRRGPQGGRGRGRRPRPGAGSAGRVSPAGCAGGPSPAPARPPRARILAALALAAAALLALAGCSF